VAIVRRATLRKVRKATISKCTITLALRTKNTTNTMYDDHHHEEPSQDGFQQRVLAYAQHVFWPGAPAAEITVEQLPSSGGGQGNRFVFSVTRRWRRPLMFNHPGWNIPYYPHYLYPYNYPYPYPYYYPENATMTTLEEEEQQEEGYIIRLPRETNYPTRRGPNTTPPLTDLESDIAAHCFVGGYTTIPIAPLEFYDLTGCNALGMPNTAHAASKG
jgi:hypothetical protein